MTKDPVIGNGSILILVNMQRLMAFALTVFVAAFVVHVVVVGLWPDSSVDWYTALVIAAATATVLTFVQRTRSE